MKKRSVGCSPGDAAEKFLGWKGKRRSDKLRYIIKKKEKKLGIEIAERIQYPNGKVGLLVTEDGLRKHIPELFEASIVGIARELRSRIDALDSKIADKVSECISERLGSSHRQSNVILSETHRVESGLLTEIEKLSRRISRIEAERSK